MTAATTCPMACGPSCSYRCPISLPDAVDRLVAELARCADALETITECIVFDEYGNCRVGRLQIEGAS